MQFFFVEIVTRGKLLEENYKSLGVNVYWKTIISILGMKENSKQKTLLHSFTCTTCILNHQNILYHQKPIVCFTFASQFQIYINFLVFNYIFNHNCPRRKKKLFLNFKGMKWRTVMNNGIYLNMHALASTVLVILLYKESVKETI